MNEYNHIDSFFRKSLSASKNTGSEFLPSPLTWENAHAVIKELYRKKKKRRFFFILLLGIILSLGIVSYLGGTWLRSDPSIAPSHGQNLNDQGAGISTKKLDLSKAPARNGSITEISKTEASADLTSSQNAKPAIIPNSVIYQSIVSEDSKQKAETANTYSEGDKEQVSEFKKPQELPTVNEKQAGPSGGFESDVTIAPVKKLPIGTLDLGVRPSITPLNGFSINTLHKEIPFNKWKVGLGYSRFLSNPFTQTKEDNGPDQTINLVGSSYKSLDFSLERRLSRHFSIITGFNYFQQTIEIGFDIQNLVYNRESEVTDLLVLTRDAFTRNVFRNSRDLSINFLPSASVVDGDLLHFSGNIPITLDAVQIPVLVKYTHSLGRVNLRASSGIVGTYMRVGVTDLPVKITKDSVLVSEDINYKPIFDARILPNISLSLGAEIPILPNVNLFAGVYTFNLNKDYIRFNCGLNYEF